MLKTMVQLVHLETCRSRDNRKIATKGYIASHCRIIANNRDKKIIKAKIIVSLHFITLPRYLRYLRHSSRDMSFLGERILSHGVPIRVSLDQGIPRKSTQQQKEIKAHKLYCYRSSRAAGAHTHNFSLFLSLAVLCFLICK